MGKEEIESRYQDDAEEEEEETTIDNINVAITDLKGVEN